MTCCPFFIFPIIVFHTFHSFANGRWRNSLQLSNEPFYMFPIRVEIYVHTSLILSFKHTGMQPRYGIKYWDRQGRRNNMYSPFGSICIDSKYTSVRIQAKCSKLLRAKKPYAISKINAFVSYSALSINTSVVSFISFLTPFHVPSSWYLYRVDIQTPIVNIWTFIKFIYNS